MSVMIIVVLVYNGGVDGDSDKQGGDDMRNYAVCLLHR